MIGLGKWGCRIDSVFYKGEVRVTVSDDGGDYAGIQASGLHSKIYRGKR